MPVQAMRKPIVRFVKLILFAVIFYVLCIVCAAVFRNDRNAYTRILMHELHNQDSIDILFCGASHVSHGLYPDMMNSILGKKTFCTGTPSQGILATYAIIRETVSLYDIKEIFLEMDFAVATRAGSFSTDTPSTSKFLASHYLKNPRIKLDYVLRSTAPAYWLNSALPAGTEKLIDLNPKEAWKTVASKISGSYFRCEFEEDGRSYWGKGCIADHDTIENGTFSSDEIPPPIAVDDISDDYKKTIGRIIALCKERNIRLFFYAHPNSDFYLCEKGNYDAFHSAIQQLLAERGFRFYDFNLCKDEFLSLEDRDFCDDNHLNGSGIRKFTETFCAFYKELSRQNGGGNSSFFHETYAQKLASQPPKILGIMFNELADKNSVEIIPVLNHGSGTVSFDIFIDGTAAAEHSTEAVFSYPEGASGTMELTAYYDGVPHCHAKKYINALY